MSRDDFNHAMSLLIAAVGKEMPDNQLEAWWLMLKDLSPDELRHGIISAIKSHEFAGFPPIGVVLKHARPTLTTTVAERCVVAWGAIKRTIALHGAYATVEFDDPIVNATIRELGGWVRFCDCEPGEKFDVWLRKDFERTYSTLSLLGTTAERTAALPGICDITNSKLSHARLTAVMIRIGLPQPTMLVSGEKSISLTPIPMDLVKSLGLPELPTVTAIIPKTRDQQIDELKRKIEAGKTDDLVAKIRGGM